MQVLPAVAMLCNVITTFGIMPCQFCMLYKIYDHFCVCHVILLFSQCRPRQQILDCVTDNHVSIFVMSGLVVCMYV